MATSSRPSPTPPALSAMRSLADVVHRARGDQPAWALQLMVQLRAAADALISKEAAASRDSVKLGCQSYLELVMQAADASMRDAGGADALHVLRRRSDRYVLQVADSVKHLVAHGCDLLTARLAEGEARGGGGGSGITAGSSMLMRRGSGVGSGSLPIPRPPPPAAATGLSSCVFTHGFCPYVTALLLRAAQQTHFTLVVAEESPTGTGHKTAEALLSAGVPVRMIEFGAVARSIAQCQLVLVGADAVLADGGILAKVGTLTMAHAAHAHGRPFYVAAPHHVFSNTHHLDATAQTATRGVPGRGRHKLILVEQPTQDATPPSLVTLLLTDVGVLTPSAVADEMMQRQLR